MTGLLFLLGLTIGAVCGAVVYKLGFDAGRVAEHRTEQYAKLAEEYFRKGSQN